MYNSQRWSSSKVECDITLKSWSVFIGQTVQCTMSLSETRARDLEVRRQRGKMSKESLKGMKNTILKNSVFCKGLLQLSISVFVTCIENEILQQLFQHTQRSFILLWPCVFSSTLE